MKPLFLTILVLGLAATGFAESADEAAVRAAHDAFVKAAREGDRASLEKIFAEGLQYSHSNTKLEDKQEAINALVKSKGNFEVHSQTARAWERAILEGYRIWRLLCANGGGVVAGDLLAGTIDYRPIDAARNES